MSSAPELPTTASDTTAPGPGEVRHLDWCLPAFCETITHSTGRETLHRGGPTVRQMTGDDADVTMCRAQYDEAGETFFEVHFTHRAYPEEITLTFSDDDVNWLATGVHELRECR